MNTTENNKLIAEFLGYEVLPMNKKDYMVITNNKETYNLKSLRFHNDWNWLMEVVKKIESLEFNCEISTDSCTIHSCLGYEVFETYNNTKIEAVYNACVDFILWYNKQTAQEK